MGNSMGQTRTLFTERMGRSIQVSADGAPKYKAGGITVSWFNIPACPAIAGTYYGKTVAAGADGVGYVEFEDGVIVKTGEKAIRYGSVMIYDAALDLDPSVTTGAGSPQGAYRLALTGDTFTKSNVFIANETVLEEDIYSNHIGVIEGGRLWRARIVKSDTTQADTTWVQGDQAEAAITAYTSAAASVPPTLAQIQGVLPLVVWALDN
jgi:hypothetical protein